MRRLSILFWLFLLVGCAVRQPAQAQFIGFTSPQTTQEQVFTSIATGTFTQNVANRGQNTHSFYYRVLSGAAATMEATIEGSFDGTTFFTISDTARALTEGITTASGYFPVVRCRLVTSGGGSPVTSGWYSGTSISLEAPRGLSDASAIGTTIIAEAQDDSVLLITTFNPPGRNAGGQYTFHYNNSITPGSSCELEVNPSTEASGQTAPSSTFKFHIAQEANQAQRFLVPNIPADQVQITYNCNVFPAGDYDLQHVAGDTATPRNVFVKFPALSATGTTTGVPVTAPIYDNDIGVNSFSVYSTPNIHTVQLNVAGAPATCTFQLEGSINTLRGVTGTWFDLSGAQTCTSNVLFFVLDKPVAWIRGNLTALTGGTSPGVTMRYLSSGP